MSGPDNEAYWVDRHESLKGKLASVGDIGSPEDINLQRYARKKRRVVDILRSIERLDLRGRSVLDAGCGIGLVSELFYALGANVSGVDASPLAIAQAKNRCPGEIFKVGSLVDFSFDGKFDLTFSVDVLYHVVKDENWALAVRNLAKHTAPGGYLVIIDQLRATPESPASHVTFRTKRMYDAVLGECSAKDRTPHDEKYYVVYQLQQ